MAETHTIQISITVTAPREQVYQAFSSSVGWEHWFSDYAEVAPIVPGRLFFFWQSGHHASGVFKEIQENEGLTFTWQGRGEDRETEVTVNLNTAGEGTQVEITHTGLGSGEAWEHIRSTLQSSWESSLENLKSVLETGLDQRLYQRPMLGVYVNQEVNQELADKLGLPVVAGIQIGGVLASMGAEAAGLQAEDILVRLNQHQLVTFNDVGQAIAGLKAGAVVPVDFYRGNETQHVEMTLSHRPFPQVPESAADLAEQVAQAYQQCDAALEKICQDVTETEAAFKPGQGEWSAKETLVHLVYTERWLHLALSCWASDQRTGGFANQAELIGAMADCYTLPELVAELKRCEDVTVKSMAALPADFVQDKRKFVRLADGQGQGFSQHTLNHIPQIEAAIAAARKK